MKANADFCSYGYFKHVDIKMKSTALLGPPLLAGPPLNMLIPTGKKPPL